MPNELKKNYFSQIQMLRAFSVILIFFFHTNIELFSKGYLGVDIFFVISGYVITKILEEKFFYNNKYQFKKFFISRVTRIIPVYFFVILFFILIFLIIGPLTDFDYIKQKLLYIFTFLSNFYYINYQKEYFDNIFQDPLNHTWSLSVEMQFYLFFPFFYYFLKKKLYSIQKTLILFIISLILLNYYFINSANLTFYLPVFRAWEFLLGSLIYTINYNNHFKKKLTKLHNYNHIFFIIFLLIIFLNKNSKFIDLILITGATSLFLLLINKNYSSSSYIAKLFIYLGNRSYSIYLWHLPVLYFFNVYFEGKFIILYALGLTILLSHYSYKFLENKIKIPIIKRSYFFLISILSIILFLVCIKIYYFQIKNFIIENNYLEKKFSLTARVNYTEIKINNNQIFPYCTPHSPSLIKPNIKFDNPMDKCLKFTNYKSLVFIEGNSHTAMFVPLILNSRLSENILFLNNSQYSYVEANNFLKNFEKVIYIRHISDFNELKHFKDNLKYFDNNISFIIFTPIPNFYSNKIKPVECLIQNKECSFQADEDFRNRNLKNFYKELDNFKENIGNINLFYFNPYKVLCPTKNCNIYNINNRILTYRDNNHLTIEGSLLLKTEFDFFLQNNDIY